MLRGDGLPVVSYATKARPRMDAAAIGESTLMNTVRCLSWMAVAVVFLAGCSSAKKGPPPGDFRALYDSGQFSAAYEAASAKASSSRGTAAEEASLYAGLSAYRMGRVGDAHRHLVPLVSNANKPVAGRACAALGSLAASQNTPAAAAEYFIKAAGLLTGDDAARAFMYAGDARSTQGKAAEAREFWQRARENVQSDVQLSMAIGDRLGGHTGGGTSQPSSGAFTIQAGAFKVQKTAQGVADSLAKKGLAARIVPIKDRNGASLYSVRVGRYQTKAEAEAQKAKVGSGAIVTAAE